MSRNSTTLAVFCVFPDTRTQETSSDKTKDTTHFMNNSRACKVMEYGSEGVHHKAAVRCIHQPAATPGPMTFYRINQQTDDKRVDHIHGELRTFGHRTRYDGCGCSAENCFKDQKTFSRQSRTVRVER